MEAPTTRVHCTHGDECGACALLGEGYEDQIRRKRDVLAKTLGAHPALRGVVPLECLPSPVVSAYRNRAKMAIGMSSRVGLRVGYFRSGTREIIDAPDCRVLVPELLETTRRIRGFLQKSPHIPRSLRHIDLRCGTDPTLQHLTLVFRATELPKFPLDALIDRCPAVNGMSYNLNNTAGPQVIRGSVRPLWGEREIWVVHEGLRLRVSPAAFFQVNLALLPTIHGLMQSFFGRGNALADLYAGVGTHGLALRRNFRRILFAEGNRSAIADLKSTIARDRIRGTLVSPLAVERGLGRLLDHRPDAVVLNPSRAGVLESVLDAVSQCPATKVAYLSCDPATLCRDLEFLSRRRFVIQSVLPIDMMPQTKQVEALALLTHRSSGLAWSAPAASG